MVPGQSGEVVGEIGETDLCPRPDDADGANDEAEAVLLGSEDVLDARADAGPIGIASGNLGWHRLAAWLLVLELGAQAPPRQQDQVRLGSVGAIRLDGSRRVLAVEHLAELRAVMGGGMGHGVASDEAIFAVDANMCRSLDLI